MGCLMRLQCFFVGLMLISAVSCDEVLSPETDELGPSPESGDDPGKEDGTASADTPLFQWVASLDMTITHTVQQCNYNGYQRVGWYDVAVFDASAIMEQIRGFDGESDGDRIYSRSHANGMEMFLRHIEDFRPSRECFNEWLNDWERENAVAIVLDPNNLGVFASVPVEEEPVDSVYPDYRFYIFRSDGTVLRWSFSTGV